VDPAHQREKEGEEMKAGRTVRPGPGRLLSRAMVKEERRRKEGRGPGRKGKWEREKEKDKWAGPTRK
jgi:hypothetical protein